MAAREVHDAVKDIVRALFVLLVLQSLHHDGMRKVIYDG